jgi:DNA-binding SARP family transcriptional activator
MGKLEVRLLGPFEVVVAGQRVEVPGAKRQALVACLALRAGRVVSTDKLVEALWGSKLPTAPRNAVQHHVTRLRRALGTDTIRLAADGYALEDAVVDASEFEELLTAARTALRAGDARGAADTIADALSLWRRRPGGWTRFGSMRWRSGSRRLSRSASTPTSYLQYALRSTRARSASACGGS